MNAITPRVWLKKFDWYLSTLNVRHSTFLEEISKKIVVSRWLGGKPKVLLLDEPTQGVDVGAKKEIYQLIIQVAKESAVILATSEINEAVGIADRILVMRNGKIVTELTYENADSKAIMSYAAGVKQ
jgi:ABC-type sugar transport system, ATPase component